MFDNMSSPIGEKVYVAAHRGRFGGSIPENTLAAFDVALKGGADIIETDITKLADGNFVLFHDPDISRVTVGKGPAESYTYEALSKMELINVIGEPTEFYINTLDEMLAHLKGRCLINLDKCWGYLDEVFDRVMAYGMERQILLKNHVTCKEDVLWMKRTGYQPIYVPVIRSENEIAALYDLLSEIDVKVIEIFVENEETRLLSKEFVADMHRRGIRIWVNALDLGNNLSINGRRGDNKSLLENPDEGWGWYVRRGVDIIQTDWVTELTSYLESVGKR